MVRCIPIEMVEPRKLLDLADPYVVNSEGAVNAAYPSGRLLVESEEGGPSVRVICVAVQEGKVLVAVPHSTWHRNVAHRILATGTFKKPAAVEVAACPDEDRHEPADGGAMKIWMGFFTLDYASLLEEFAIVFDEVDYDFEPSGMVPTAEALKELAVEHFAFFSAAEAVDQDGAEGAGSVPLSDRVSKLEDLMSEVNLNIAKLVSLGPGNAPSVGASPKKVPARPSALRTPKVKIQAAPTTIPTPPATAEEMHPDLDPSVVAAALQSGIEPGTLEQMQQLVNVNKKGSHSLKQSSVLPMNGPLSDSEEEEQQDGGQGGSGSAAADSDPMHSVLNKLTDIVGQLAKQKNKKGSKLDQALDGVTAQGESSSSTGLKRAAAARRTLRSALIESPVDLYTNVEKLMAEDILSQTIGPGLSAPSFSARAWVEHRSSIGAYKAVAHASWGVAGIIDALRAGKSSEARARSNLLLLQIDQSCVDRGSWALATELSLENPPPFSKMASHQSPDISNGEQPYSKILDSRWAEICLSYLRDQDDFASRRRNIGKLKKSLDNEDKEDTDRLRKPKAKAKPKASPDAQ